MAPKESKICKLAAVGITRQITFTIPETLETIRKPGSATCQNVITVAYKHNAGESKKRDVHQSITYLALSKCRIGMFSVSLDNPNVWLTCYQTQVCCISN